MAAVFRRVRPLSRTRALILERPAAILPSAAMDKRRQSFGARPCDRDIEEAKKYGGEKPPSLACSPLSSTSVKVILKDDVAGTGYRGEYVEVKGGFMRNYLFPNKRAIYATEDNRLLYESLDRTAERERAAALKTIKRGRQEMTSIPIILKRHLPPRVTRLEQAVTAKHVCGYLQKNMQFKGTQEDVRMPNGSPIMSLGEHVISVRIPLSDAAVTILQQELGLEEFEKQAWVEMTVLVEKTKAKDGQRLDEVDMEEEARVEEERKDEVDSQAREKNDASVSMRT